jgi:hypothetical protein
LNQSFSPETIFKPRSDDDPIFQLANDISRDHFKINGTSIEDSLVQLAREYTNKPNDDKILMQFVNALKNSLIEKGFPQQTITNLLQHYSQTPSYGIRKIIDLIQDENTFMSLDSCTNNLYIENEKVYFKSTGKELFIRDRDDASKHYFEGTIKSQFELTDKGFELVFFSAKGDCAALLDQKLLDKKRVLKQINLITDALKTNDLELFIYHLYTFQKYLDDTLLKIHPGMKPAKIQDWMKEKFSQEFEKDTIPNEKTFLAVQEMLTSIKFDPRENKDSKIFTEIIRLENAFYTYFELLSRSGISENANSYADDADYNHYIEKHQINMEKYLEEAMIKYYAMELPFAHVSKIIETSYETEDKERIKRKFCRYQIEHAREIYDKQLARAILAAQERIATCNEFLNEDGGKTGELGYQEHDGHSQSKIYLEMTVANELRNRLGGTIAYNFLLNIQDTILNTRWNVGTLGGTVVNDCNGILINRVPKNMVKILAIIEKAQKDDPTGKSEVWIHAINQVALLGATAAHRTSLFRDENTQEFYDTFVTAYNNIQKSNVSDQEKNALPKCV